MPFSGGTGSQLDPYLIATPSDLNELRDPRTGTTYFEQIQDIDMSYDTSNAGGLFYDGGAG